jgi:hypothetical protein
VAVLEPVPGGDVVGAQVEDYFLFSCAVSSFQ